MSELVSRPVDLAGILAQVGEVLAVAEHELEAGGYQPATTTDIRRLDATLSRARGAISERLAAAQASGESRRATTLAALLVRAEQVQLALKDALLMIWHDEVDGAQTAIHRLREAVSTRALAARIPAEAFRMGFTRVLYSHVKHGTWIACSAYAGDDRELEFAMVEAGRAHPRRLAGPLLEGEMVRRGEPILVRDPQTDPQVHAELAAVTRSPGYVAAPVYGWGRPIGLVHADRHTDKVGVQEVDREALGIFAKNLGMVFERNLMIERLQALRKAADEHLRIASGLADDFTVEVIDLAGPAPAAVDDMIGQAAAPPPAPSELSRLTARETEVLRSIAAGKTNAQIAAALFVTEGTVKSHVKHILRKLGAANRTEAVTKYHRAHGAPPA